MVVDLTVTIFVNALQQLLDLLLAEREVVALQAHAELIRADLPAIVLIEVGEGRAQVTFLQVVVGLQARGDKLCVVDQAVLVRVDHVHGVEQLGLCQVDLIDLLHALLQLLECQRAVTVLVHLGEGDAESLNLIFGDARSDQRKRGSLQLQRIHVCLDIREDVWADLNIAKLSLTLLLDPGMIVGLFGGQTHVSLPLEELVDQILSICGDIVPDGVAVRVGAAKDAVDNLLVRFTTKGRFATQHDKKDDAHGPVVALRRVAALQHLRCDIVRRAIWRIHNLILSNAFGQTEVNQLDMRVVVFGVEEEVLRLNIPTHTMKQKQNI